jgi:hypothetical protein
MRGDFDRFICDYAWPSDFPKGYGHTSIYYLQSRIGYADAKAGDEKAAESVVRQCLKYNRVQYIKRLYPNAVLLPVLGINKLPLALAKAIGLPVHTDVYVIHPAERKKLSAMQRMLTKPKFYINYLPPCEYIIVDDIITQGGTVAELRRYVIISGGKVAAILALAYAIGSHTIAPAETAVEKIKDKFGQTELTSFLKKYNISAEIEELTNSQCRYLLRFSNIFNITKKAALTKKIDSAIRLNL